jgi:hypothetical protein
MYLLSITPTNLMERPNLLAPNGDPELPLLDDVEAVALLALTHDHRVVGEGLHHQGLADLHPHTQAGMAPRRVVKDNEFICHRHTNKKPNKRTMFFCASVSISKIFTESRNCLFSLKFLDERCFRMLRKARRCTPHRVPSGDTVFTEADLHAIHACIYGHTVSQSGEYLLRIKGFN